MVVNQRTTNANLILTAAVVFTIETIMNKHLPSPVVRVHPPVLDLVLVNAVETSMLS